MKVLTWLIQDISKQFAFSGDFSTKYASLVLGIVQIQNESFLLYVESVSLQPPFPLGNASVYQIHSVNFLQLGAVVSRSQHQVFTTLNNQIFNFGFYFSFKRDLTLTLQYTDASKREMYFWNQSMLQAMQIKHLQWQIPVIQGHYGKLNAVLNTSSIEIYLISRRSKYRSGTRFYSRGIDENARCSNFVQTQQITLINQHFTSFVIVSGSIPIFWEQKSQSDKVRLTRNKQLTTIPFLAHFQILSEEYNKVMVMNLLQQKKENEKILLSTYQQLFQENALPHTKYYFFDINESYKQRDYLSIYRQLVSLQPIIKEFGFYKRSLSGAAQLQQGGIFRISCLDCLFRTSNFMQVFCYYVLHQQLVETNAVANHCSQLQIQQLLFRGDAEVSPFMLLFRNLWREKADFQSMIYSGTRAVNCRKNHIFDELQNSFVALKRMYNQKFIDTTKQRALDIILHHRNYQMKSRGKREFSVGVVTWNVNATEVEKLEYLGEVVEKCVGQDIVVFGMQEVVELNTNNVMNWNEEEESRSAVMWGRKLEKLLQRGTEKYVFVQKIQLVGMLIVVFVKDKWLSAVKSVHKDTVKTAAGGMYGNKGAVIIRISIYSTSFCFVCVHLTAGQSATKERMDDFVSIHERAFQQSKVGVQNEREIGQSDYKFFFGDLNFRIEHQMERILSVLESIQTREDRVRAIVELLDKDQLSEIRRDSSTHPLITQYSEGVVDFLPTYKLERETGKYSLEKKRKPSWCDRILFWADESELPCKCEVYTSVNVVGSDHRPVIGLFKCVVQ